MELTVKFLCTNFEKFFYHYKLRLNKEKKLLFEKRGYRYNTKIDRQIWQKKINRNQNDLLNHAEITLLDDRMTKTQNMICF